MTAFAEVPPPSPSRRRVPAWAGHALLWLLLWLGLIRFPAAPTSGLDPSWRQVLGYALEHDLQFGTDLVFTYGPLGILLANTNDGFHFPALLAWQLLGNAVFATIIWLVGRGLGGWRLAAYYVYFAVLGLGYADAVHMTIILLVATGLLRDPVMTRRWLVVLAAGFLALLALIKFTNLMLAGFALACVCGYHAWRKRWVDLALVGGTFAAAFVAGWAALGQSPANLPAFILNSLNASGGYTDGMSFYETGYTLFLGLGAALAVGAYYLLSLARRDDLPRAVGLMLIAAATSFLNWKHGYVRADGHVFAHYITCLLIAVSFPVLLQDGAVFRRTKGALLGLAAFFSLAGVYHASPVSLTDAPAIWNYQLKGTVNSLRIFGDLPRNARAEYAAVQQATRLPSLVSLVRQDTVDLIGSEQAYVIFNGLNYTPRPVFQNYFPYTRHLARLNEEFFRSPEAPAYVLQRMDMIDLRLPAADDSLSTRHVYWNHDYLNNEAGFLVWRKRDPGNIPVPATPLTEFTTTFGEEVPVPEAGDGAVWVEVDFRPTLIGRLRAFLYKPPIVMIRVRDSRDTEASYRLVQELGRTGFLARPHFASIQDIEKFHRVNEESRLTAFTLELPERDRAYFQRDVRVRFSALPPMPRAPAPPPETQQTRFRVINRTPDAESALYPANVLADDGMELLFAHPPSSLEFNLANPASRITGKFGLASKAYTPPNQTDGCEFLVEWVAPDGEVRVLFQRLLRPVGEPADRGPQSFDVAVPPGGGVLKLRITPGPQGDLSFDWAYWTDVQFHP